jgi:hypothetical protein
MTKLRKSDLQSPIPVEVHVEVPHGQIANACADLSRVLLSSIYSHRPILDVSRSREQPLTESPCQPPDMIQREPSLKALC